MTIFSGKSYLEKHRFAPRQIHTAPSKKLNMVVVIPSHCEPDLLQTLDSLEKCDAPQKEVEVIVVINNSERASEEVKKANQDSLKQAQNWAHANSRTFSYHFLNFPSLPKKHAGVGLARKVGMDEAVDRLEQVENPNGVIVCLDADSQIVPNYLVEIEKAFELNKRTACSIHFEHPLSGDSYTAEVYEGILRYELYLRYYIEGLRFAGYPYAFHTIGSSMAVRSRAYQSESGMNRRKAGEDFYFLHKFIPNPGFFELNSTCVIPSPRPAEKVPFGTGKSIVKWLESGAAFYPAYDPRAFLELRGFLKDYKKWYVQDPPKQTEGIEAFMEKEEFQEAIVTTRKNVKNQAAFEKRFFQWFHPLKVLQYIHFTRDQHWPEIEVLPATQQLWEMMNQPAPEAETHEGYLRALRKKQAGL